MLNRLLSIDPSKKALQFLHDRVLAVNYRGLQISQHNRYTYEQVKGMIKIFYNLVGRGKMYIRTTDLSKRPYNEPNELIYAMYTDQVNSTFGKSTQDSIRKNLFVDFHRMGLIDRFGIEGHPLNPYERKPVKQVALTELALELISEDLTHIQQYMVFSRCLDNIMLGLVTDMFDVLAVLDNLTIHEYTFFISFARQKLGNNYISLDEVVEYVKEYRSLSKHNRDYIVRVVQEYCDPTTFFGDKTNKRDFHNWINESQQIFMLLDMTAYYDLNPSLNRIELMVKSGYVFNSPAAVTKLKRSISEKKEYFKNHRISKTIGYELHHIVPLLWAKNSTEFFLLDKWQNMLYIDGGIHSVITQSGNKHVILKFIKNSDTIRLYDAGGDRLELEMPRNVIYNPINRRLMHKNNRALINSF